jgi:hypothetical protein
MMNVHDTARPAQAQPLDHARGARDLPVRGTRRSQSGRERGCRSGRPCARHYAGALAEYQASYDKYPKPYLLFHIAECQQNLGQDADALATYKKYLGKVSHGADRKKAEAAVAELQPKVDAVAAAAAAQPEPAPPPVPVAQANDSEAPPMDAQAIAAAKARDTTGPVDTTATAPKPDVVPPEYDPNAGIPPRNEPLPPGERPPVYKRWWPWTILTAGVIVGVSIGLGVGLGLPHFHSELPVGGPGAHAISVHALSVRF